MHRNEVSEASPDPRPYRDGTGFRSRPSGGEEIELAPLEGILRVGVELDRQQIESVGDRREADIVVDFGSASFPERLAGRPARG